MTDAEVAKWIESESWLDQNWSIRRGSLVHVPTMRAVGIEACESSYQYYGEPVAKWGQVSLDGVRFTVSVETHDRLKSIRNRLLITTKSE